MTKPEPPAYTIPPAFGQRRLSASTVEIRIAERTADMVSAVEQMPIKPNDINDEWLRHAACATADPDLFHPIADPATSRAIALLAAALLICDGCPVHAACRGRRYDLGAAGSVWGGVYYPTRARGVRPCATKGCSSPVAGPNSTYCGFEHEHAVKVGTDAGYNLHQRAKVPACAACKQGHYDARQKYDHTGQFSRASAQRGVRSATPGRRVASA